jgi:hypothetical protein
MLKRIVLALLLALQFVVITSQGVASVPEPGCYPCPGGVAQK